MITLTLSDGASTISLLADPGQYVALDGLLTPPPVPEIVWSESRLRDGAEPGPGWYPNRDITLPLVLAGATPDAVFAYASAIQLMCNQSWRYWRTFGAQGRAALLTVQWDRSNYAVQWDVKTGRLDPGPSWSQVPLLATDALVSGAVLSLTCSPHAEEATLVTDSAVNQQALGASLTLTNTRGEVDTPAKISIATHGTLSGHVLFWAARRSRGAPANFQHILEADVAAAAGTTTFNAGAYSSTDLATFTYARQADATASNGFYGQWSWAGAATTQLIAQWLILLNLSDHYGDFRVYARMRRNNGALTRGLQLYYGATNSPSSTPGLVTATFVGTQWTMVDLGVIHWPEMVLPAGLSVSTLALTLALTTSGAEITDIDCLLLVPVGEGSVFGAGTATLAANDIAVMDGTAWPPSTYITDSGGVVKTLQSQLIVPAGGYPKVAPGAQRWFAYIGDPTNDVLSNQLDVSIARRPRAAWLRGA